MKAIITLIAFFISYCSVSQTIVPFPDSLASWTIVDSYYTITGPNPILDQVITISNVDEFCMNDLDTIINSNTYKQLDDCSGNYLGAIRDSGGVVTYVPKDSVDAYLAYDFTAQQGDTMEIYLYDYNYLTTPEMVEVVVNGIDSIDIGDGVFRKSLSLYSNTYYCQLFAMAGIGSEVGLFHAIFPNVSNSGVGLFCMTENNVTLRPTYNQECGNVSLSENSLKKIEVYPNPASDYLIISNDFGEEEVIIEMFNAMGIMVLQRLMVGSGLEIDISDLSSGMYWVKLQKDGLTQVVKIVKE